MTFDYHIIQNAISLLCIIGGLFFIITGIVGLIRLPGFLAKIHAVSVSDSFGVPLVLCGLMILSGINFVSLKIFVILLALFIATPFINMEMSIYYVHKKREDQDD